MSFTSNLLEDGESIYKHEEKFFWCHTRQNILKQGWEGKNNPILKLLPAAIIQQNILAYVYF